MPCWVVPTIAAEIWGVPVDHVLQQVRDGNLAYRVDDGFMFVDVLPAAPPPPPPTFTVLSEAEVDALADEILDAPRGPDPDEKAESQSPDDDEASIDLGDWRAARQRASRTRIPPPRPNRAAPQAA